MTVTDASTSGLARTGVAGLDDVLCGGFPRDRLYLLQGNPGSGKTTLAMQFLLEGVRAGERCLHITLSETEEELRAVAGSHGWSLDGISIFELAHSAGDDMGPGAQQTVFHSAEVELSETMRTLLDEVERVKPARVVFDSLSEVRLLAQSALRYRRQMLALKRHFAGTRCTVLLLDDLTSEPGDQNLQSLAHGVITLEQTSRLYGADRRRLRVSKLRGVQYRSGYHDFAIERGGVRAYPRLVAAEHESLGPKTPVSSGIPALDALLGGGFEPGTSVLVMGPPGAGKSALASQYAGAVAAGGERAAIFSFEESLDVLFARGEALGAGLRGHAGRGLLLARHVSPVELSSGEFMHMVRRAVERDGARLVVVDSLGGYLNALPEEHALLSQLHELFLYLARRGVVTVLTVAQRGLMGPSMSSPVDASYLADTVILLRYFEAAGRIRKAISVMKKRAGAHENTIREFVTGAGGIRVGEPLEAFRGVLTGVPVYTGEGGPPAPGGAGRPP